MTVNSHESPKALSRSRGFITYDALFSILPIVLMLAFIIQTMAIAVADANKAMDQRETFNLLVVAADYTVKLGASKTDATGNIIPNWIEESKLADLQSKLTSNLKQEISLSLDQPGSGSICIYRLVVTDSRSKAKDQIRKLYVCGDYANP